MTRIRLTRIRTRQLSLADQIVQLLGTDAAVLSAARAVVQAEKNFNPFVASVPSVCADPSLPDTAELRGVIPLVDPDVGESDVENANSASSLTTPFAADGLSVAEIMVQQGFANFTAVDAGGSVVDVGAVADPAGDDDAEPDTDDNAEDTTGDDAAAADPDSTDDDDDVDDDGDIADNDDTTANYDNDSTDNATPPSCTPVTTPSTDTKVSDTPGQSTLAVSFGICTPTMAFLPGLGGRPATEFTFIPQDALVALGQQEALNPNIITNRICDQLTNVCDADDAAKAACLSAKAEIQALGTRDLSTAQRWNELLGFSGVDASAATV